MADICFLVLLDFLALEVRPLACVIATVFNWDFILGVLIGGSGLLLVPFLLIRV